MPFTLCTFGDSILDCAHYNAHRVSPGGLIVRNDDGLFPEFRGRDLTSRGDAVLVHRAQDGAVARDLDEQLQGFSPPDGQAAALVTIGGNDLLSDLFYDSEPDLDEYTRTLTDFLQTLPVRPVFVGNVYDPTCGDDALNFLGIAPAVARRALARMNGAIADVVSRTAGATLVDLHAHFLTGDTSWFVRTIEPSLRGASEVRRAFLAHLLPG